MGWKGKHKFVYFDEKLFFYFIMGLFVRVSRLPSDENENRMILDL